MTSKYFGKLSCESYFFISRAFARETFDGSTNYLFIKELLVSFVFFPQGGRVLNDSLKERGRFLELVNRLLVSVNFRLGFDKDILQVFELINHI